MTVSAHSSLATTSDFVGVASEDKPEPVSTEFIAGISAAIIIVLLGCVVIVVTLLLSIIRWFFYSLSILNCYKWRLNILLVSIIFANIILIT